MVSFTKPFLPYLMRPGPNKIERGKPRQSHCIIASQHLLPIRVGFNRQGFESKSGWKNQAIPKTDRCDILTV